MGYIGEPTQDPRNLAVAYARPQGTDVLYGGYLIAIDELEDTYENRQVYVAGKPAADTTFYGVVLNGGYETLPDGRRPEGQPNFTEYGFRNNMAVTVLRPEKFQTFRVGLNAITGTPTVGQYLVPTVGDYVWAVETTKPASGLAVKVEKLTEVGTGGMFGMGIEVVAEVIVVSE